MKLGIEPMARYLGFEWTDGGYQPVRGSGFRCTVPVWINRRSGYDLDTDRVYFGWWLAVFSVAIEPIGQRNGVSIRLTWGSSPAKNFKKSTAKA